MYTVNFYGAAVTGRSHISFGTACSILCTVSSATNSYFVMGSGLITLIIYRKGTFITQKLKYHIDYLCIALGNQRAYIVKINLYDRKRACTVN